MYSDIIDGLNDDQIMSLYDDTIIDGLEDGVLYGACHCRTSSSYIHFGHQAHGGCSLLRRSIPDEARCLTWCRRNGFYSSGFYSSCFCSSTSTYLNVSVGGFTACR